jgi:hypothetical protein
LKYRGTARKLGGNRENKPQPTASGETCLLASLLTFRTQSRLSLRESQG